MHVPICTGRVSLNVDGKRYTASFRVEQGVITVMCGSDARRVEIGDIEDPKSVARTVLRTMVTDGRVASAPEAEAKAPAAEPQRFLVRLRASAPHSRTYH
jgi:hypothetical protein